MKLPTDPVFMHIPPWHRQWFENINSSMTFSIHEPLVVQPLSVLQGRVDTGILLNEHFDRVLSILDIHCSMRELEAHESAIDREIDIMIVSKGNSPISVQSEKILSTI